MHEHENTEVPLVLTVDLAGELLGLERARAYAAARTGVIPTLPGPGRRRVPTARLEMMVGRRLTVADIEAAERRLRPKREASLKYQREYREARKVVVA